jgi:hypothetical protein
MKGDVRMELPQFSQHFIALDTGKRRSARSDNNFS